MTGRRVGPVGGFGRAPIGSPTSAASRPAPRASTCGLRAPSATCPGSRPRSGGGRSAYSKVRALTRVATPENEAKLLGVAKTATAAQLERICRGLALVTKTPRAEAVPLGHLQARHRRHGAHRGAAPPGRGRGRDEGARHAARLEAGASGRCVLRHVPRSRGDVGGGKRHSRGDVRGGRRSRGNAFGLRRSRGDVWSGRPTFPRKQPPVGSKKLRPSRRRRMRGPSGPRGRTSW